MYAQECYVNFERFTKRNIACSCTVILDTICTKIKSASCFSVIVDEARDVSISEQMSICIRYLLGDKLYERFL